MKYSSKQRLATAMAATMALSMAPAMAFAAPLDDVVTELGSERVEETKAGNLQSAEAALAKADAMVKSDAYAQMVVDAYRASLNVLKSTTLEEYNTNKAAFDAAVMKLAFLNKEHKDNLARGFESAQTKANHDAIKAKYEAPAADPTATYKTSKILGVVLVEVSLKDATAADVTKVMINGAEVTFAKDEKDPNMVTANFDAEVTKVEVEVKGKLIEATK